MTSIDFVSVIISPDKAQFFKQFDLSVNKCSPAPFGWMYEKLHHFADRISVNVLNGSNMDLFLVRCRLLTKSSQL